MSESFAFELGPMAEARNYYQWLCGSFAPLLHGTVVEHGAGTGLLSDRLREHSDNLVLVEPDDGFYDLLAQRFQRPPESEVFHGTVEELNSARGDETADAVVSANVLEHVPDDRGCLRSIARLLKKGGYLCLYVPARPELFGTLDERFEHCRRYDRKELEQKIRDAGLRVVSAQYRNLVGALAWWLSGRVLKRTSLAPNQVRFYDRFVFPVTSRLESVLAPPYGQNLLVIARK
ncbi:MAG TPA: class I SAM-dependent methyltransferase [Polyangia bacterium]|jgi:SAM-dependent methyltransferase|nr:class I SAM-dependent methyltransferase [Polyangia bacterium]